MVFLDGRFIEPETAVVPLLDRGYLLGDGVFATMRGYDGVCFRSEQHLANLARGAKLFGIDLPASLPELAELANDAARRTGAADAYVRVTLTRGVKTPTLSILARAMDVPSADAYARGVAAVIVGPRRIPPACIDPTVKTTSYAVPVLARREAEAKGAAEGIQLAIDGSLASGTMSNLFFVAGDELLTPSLESGCRAGVTRSALLEIAARVGLRPSERRIEPSFLAEADEAFFSSTRIECLPIATVDGAPIGQGHHRTHELRAAFQQLVRGDHA